MAVSSRLAVSQLNVTGLFMLRVLGGLLVVLLVVLAGCSSGSAGGPESAGSTAAETAPADGATAEVTQTVVPAPTPTPLPPPLAMNHVQVIGSHNSYHVRPDPALFDALATLSPELAESRNYSHRPLAQQLETFGIRQLELDVYADPAGGLFSNPAANPLVGLSPLDDPALTEPGFKVLHVQDYDYATTCVTLAACLGEVAEWSNAHPRHLPILIMIEFKSESVPVAAAAEGLDLSLPLDWTLPLEPTEALLSDLDRTIRDVFDSDQFLEPDDVRGDAATLNEAVTDNGWPSLEQSRGQLMFALIGDGIRDLYVIGAPSLQGRAMFTSPTIGDPDAAFLSIDDPTDPRIAEAVAAGYLVRTRTDVPTADARRNDTTRRDAALASGAHFLSTDYYAPSEYFESGYVVELPGDAIARCNPAVAPVSCSDEDLAG